MPICNFLIDKLAKVGTTHATRPPYAVLTKLFFSCDHQPKTGFNMIVGVDLLQSQHNDSISDVCNLCNE